MKTLLLICLILQVQSQEIEFNKVPNEERPIDPTYSGTAITNDQRVTDKLLGLFNLNHSRNHNEFFSFDGWFHNLNNQNWGSRDSPLIRLFPPKLSINDSRPNVFLLSESVLKSYNSRLSISGKNIFFVYFGLFVLNEILDSGHLRCPPSYNKIRFPLIYLGQHGEEMKYIPPVKHSFLYLNKPEHCKHVRNSVNNPLKKMNYRSVWLDGETIYGNSKFCFDSIRSYDNGKLIEPDQNDYAIKYACFDQYGSNLINDNPFMATIRLVWIRWHNFLADIVFANSASLSDEAIYLEARKLTVAVMQHIVFDEWLPVLLGDHLPHYSGYNHKTDPQISHLFDSISYLYMYSLVNSYVFKLNTDCAKDFRYSLVRTCNIYQDYETCLNNGGLDQMLNGMLLQSAHKDDHTFVEDIRSYAPGPLDGTKQDLIAILLQQSRDFDIPSYLEVRSKLGLDNDTFLSIEHVASQLWKQTTNIDRVLVRKMIQLYGNDGRHIDLFVGGILETDHKGMGQLFATIFAEQFQRIRDADRMYFENIANGLFTPEQIEAIKEIKFADIIHLVTDIPHGLVQRNAFLLPNENTNKISERCYRLLQNLFQVYSCSHYGVHSTENTCFTLTTKNPQSMETCNKGTTYDYFTGSRLSFIFSMLFIVLFVLFLCVLLKMLVKLKNSRHEKIRLKVSKLRRLTIGGNATLAQEWLGANEGYRSVVVILSSSTRSIKVKLGNRVVRSTYFKEKTGKVFVESSTNKAQNHILIRILKEYDLVLKFDSYYDREKFATKLEAFLIELHITLERSTQDLKLIFKHAYTKAKRQKHLEQFFRVVFSHAFDKKNKANIDIKTAKEIIETELTQFEFAEVLSMRPESTFVQQMFSLIDKDNNGYVSFREFLDVIIIFAKGTAEQKIRIMFDMYDVNLTGRLSVTDFKTMIKSLLEIANQSISPLEMDQTIHSMFTEIGFSSKKYLSFDDFNRLFNNYRDELGYSELNFDLANLDKLKSSDKRQTALLRANDTIVRAYSYFDATPKVDFTKPKSYLKIETEELQPEQGRLISWIRFVDAKKSEIFFVVLYTLIMLYIFLDKVYYYTYLNESSGLRQIAGLGVTLTRGTATVMMFNFSTILLTMCRNLITFMRETFLYKYIAFDSAVSFHKYIAVWAFIMALIHSLGHICNFYHISTQRPADLNCIFTETYFVDNELPKFHHWLFQTSTGLTGVLLLLLLFVIYIFAIQYSRRHIFNAFWTTHNLYPLLYILIILHGLGRLIQAPIFYIYFIVPIFLFTIDRVISASRKRIEISVVKATLHPSDVTHLEFKKPPNFEYKSGQWLRIACLELNSNEYHPFTIASAPNEDTLSLYIRAVGPFTKNLRQVYDYNTLNGKPYPKLYLDGPYGEGHQDWLKFDVSVLIGGGIGITPFASIIKDITFRSSINAKINCKKVYFLWVTRTQKHFEWMSDVIREAESKDTNNLLVTHIFITQFYDKFDLRTIMLYICERHFQKISSKSLFTGLRAKTHFGRPNFQIFLDSLQQEHPSVERVGVFSCGPTPMTNSVQQACESLNRKEGAIFVHHFENF